MYSQNFCSCSPASPSSIPSSTPSQTPSALPSSTPSANPSQGCENTRTDVSLLCGYIPSLNPNTSLHVLIPACSLSAVWLWNIQPMDGKTISTTTSYVHHLHRISIILTFGFISFSVDAIALRVYAWMPTSNVTQPVKKRSTPIHGRAVLRAGTARGSLTQSLGKFHLQTSRLFHCE